MLFPLPGQSQGAGLETKHPGHKPALIRDASLLCHMAAPNYLKLLRTPVNVFSLPPLIQRGKLMHKTDKKRCGCLSSLNWVHGQGVTQFCPVRDSSIWLNIWKADLSIHSEEVDTIFQVSILRMHTGKLPTTSCIDAYAATPQKLLFRKHVTHWSSRSLPQPHYLEYSLRPPSPLHKVLRPVTSPSSKMPSQLVKWLSSCPLGVREGLSAILGLKLRFNCIFLSCSRYLLKGQNCIGTGLGTFITANYHPFIVTPDVHGLNHPSNVIDK